MTKFSGITPNNAPSLLDYLIGVTSGNVDDRITIQSLVNLILTTNLLTIPYKFSAFRSGTTQSIAASTSTKIQLNSKTFDTGSNFDAITNFRFTAPVSGFYFFDAAVQTLLGTTATDLNVSLFKNGSLLRKGGNLKNGVYPQPVVSGLFQLSAGDYIELFFINLASADSVEATAAGTSTYLDGYLVSKT